jgi:hypothetical protein
VESNEKVVQNRIILYINTELRFNLLFRKVGEGFVSKDRKDLVENKICKKKKEK